jgi:hypothetical protein
MASVSVFVAILGMATSTAHAQAFCPYDVEPPSVALLQPAPDMSYAPGVSVPTSGITVVIGQLELRVAASDNTGVFGVFVEDDMPEIGVFQGIECTQDPNDPTIWRADWAFPDRLPGHHILQAAADDCAGNTAQSPAIDVLTF